LRLKRAHRPPPSAGDRVAAVLSHEGIELTLEHHRPELRAALAVGTGTLRCGNKLGTEHALVQLSLKLGQSLLAVVAVGRVQLHKTIGDGPGDDSTIQRIQPIVRIALGVNVSHGAVNLGGRNLESQHAF